MKKYLFFSLLFTLSIAVLGYICFKRLSPDCKACSLFQAIDRYSKTNKQTASNSTVAASKILSKAYEARLFAAKHKLNTHIGFLINMSQPSGQKRFYIIDLQKDRLIDSGLVAHGSGHQVFAETPKFGNVNGSGLSSLGKYKIGAKYDGQFGPAYRLHGLEPTNSNAFSRSVVLHSFSCVPSSETYPDPICNSLGCPMVNKGFLEKLITILDKEKQPILLWVFA